MPRPLSNPPNPWHSTEVEWLGPPPEARLEVHVEDARSILSRNDSPDLPFRWSLNPYRGCSHACAYCYARTTHQWLDWGAGTDFDRKLVVKRNAPELLRGKLASRGWNGEPILFSGNTDCYQALEASWNLTRGCIEACLERANPVVVITKAALVRRDADLLARLAERAGAQVWISIATADDAVARAVEPGASSPTRRFETLRVLAEAGVDTGVSVSPVIPGLTESQIPAVLERAAAAGAKSAFLTLLRLAGPVREVFEQRLAEAFPHRAARVLSALAELRGGEVEETGFGRRMRGEGPRWDVITSLFDVHCRKHGLDSNDTGGPRPRIARRAEPDAVHQPSLFGS